MPISMMISVTMVSRSTTSTAGRGRGNRFFPGGRGAHHFYPLGNDIGIERLDKVIGGAARIS